jgi:hypothetical protein
MSFECIGTYKKPFPALRDELLNRWNHLALHSKEGKSKAFQEVKFFQYFSGIPEYKADLALIYLTLLEFERTKRDFLGRPCSFPLSFIQEKWTFLRDIARQKFGEEATMLKFFSPEEYRSRKARLHSERVLRQQVLTNLEETQKQDHEQRSREQIQAFENSFPEGPIRTEAIKKYAKFCSHFQTSAALSVAAYFWSKTVETAE